MTSPDAGVSPSSPPDQPNIAKGRPYTLSVAPNYGLCTEPGDAVQLTDGEYTSGYFWTQKSTVGWLNKSPIITIDLGSDRAIRGLSYNTAAGVAGVTWPERIFLFVAGEDKKFHAIGDLVELHSRHGPPPAEGAYNVEKFWTGDLQTHGRYLALGVAASPFIFVDEIEVWEGDTSWLSGPLPGDPVEGLAPRVTELLVASRIRGRIQADMEAVLQKAEESQIAPSVQDHLRCERSSIHSALDNLPVASAHFRAQLPLNTLHARVLLDRAKLWQELGVSRLTARPISSWEQAPWHDIPSAKAASIHVDLLKKEHRAAQLAIANASDSEQTVSLKITGLPGGTDPSWISVHQVEWTDTRSLQPIASALPEISHGADGYPIHIPSGLDRNIWLDIHPIGVPAGTHEGKIVLSGDDYTQEIPLSILVRPLEFPVNPRLHVGGFDYLDQKNAFGVITPENRESFLTMLREHLIDAPWASPGLWPPGSYDSKGNLATPPSTTSFEAWLGLWPNAPHYRVFIAAGATFGGFAAGTPEFNTAVAQWTQFWAKEIQARKLSPTAFDVLLSDEPHEATATQKVISWTKAIHDAKTGLRVWEDITWDNPKDADPALFSSVDTICVNRQQFLQSTEAFRDFYRTQKQAGKTIEFYSCLGPSSGLDPYSYYRLQAWTAWQEGVAAMHYWSFGDTGGVSPWSEYALVGTNFSPLFLDTSSVTSAKALEGIREGVEDYECLAMLGDAISAAKKKGMNPGVLQHAQEVLDAAPGLVLGPAGTTTEWNAKLDRSTADAVRSGILEELVKLSQ